MILKNIILSFHSPKRRSTVWLHLSEALEQAKSKAGREAVWLWRGKSGTFLFYVLMGFWRVERYTRRRLQETVNSRLKVPARQAFWLNPSDSFIVTTWGKGDKNHHSIRPGTQFRLPLSLLRAAHTGGHCAHTRSLLSQLTTYVLEQRYVFPMHYLEQCESPHKATQKSHGPLPLIQKP